MTKILLSKKALTLFILLTNVLVYSQFVTTGTPPGTTSTSYYGISNVGIGYTAAPSFGTNKFMVAGNSLFNGNVGIGIAPSAVTSTKLSLSSGSTGLSGLNFSNLTSSFAPSVFNNNKALTVDATGNVILAKAIDNITHSLSGNTLTTTINGISSNSINFPNGNIYNSDGSFTSNRVVGFGNYSMNYELASNTKRVLFNSLGNTASNGAIQKIESTYNFVAPNLSGDGIFDLAFGTGYAPREAASIEKRRAATYHHLTFGGTDSPWMQSSTYGNSSLPLKINPLGGNVGIGLGQTATPTAQLHTKNTVRFENLSTSTNPTGILGTDANGNVFNFDPNLVGATSDDFWSLSGNTLATGNEFIGTINSQPLNFKVGNIPRLQITNGGRFEMPMGGFVSGNLFFGRNAGNDTVSGVYNVGVGFDVLPVNNSGALNVGIGQQVLVSNVSGSYNVATGSGALYKNILGSSNTAVGFNSGFNIKGNENVAIGMGSAALLSVGNSNVFLGSTAGGDLTGGDRNVFVGANTGVNIGPTASNQLNIANKIYGSGVDATVAIGIGVLNPQARLHTKGTLRFEDLSVSTNPTGILGTDANGNVFKYDPSLIGGSSVNIYNSDGSIPSPRNVSLTNNSNLNFNAVNFKSTFHGNPLFSNSTSVFELRTPGTPIYPNNTGSGFFKIMMDTAGYNLTQGTNENSSWIQSSISNKNAAIYTPFPLALNPLGGNIGIGLGQTVVPTAQLHTKGTLRFENIGTSTTNNTVLSVDNNGNVFKQDINSFATNNENIYNINGTITANRVLDLDDKTLTFGDGFARTIFNPNPFSSMNLAALEVLSANIPVDPNLNGIGIFKIKQEKSERYLTQGVNERSAWIQSSVNVDNNGTTYPLSINPLQGNVGIGVIEPTAQLHTVNSVRFENLPFSEQPNAILGTDVNGNVYNFDPSSLGGGDAVNIYNSDGILTDNRYLDLDGKTLGFYGNVFNQVYDVNIEPNLCPTGTSGESFSTINGFQSDVITIGDISAFLPPSYNTGYFKLKATQSGRFGNNGIQLNFGVGNDNSWMQSSSHYRTNRDGYCGNDDSKLYLNPLGGKVAIGTTNIDADTDCPDCDDYRLFVAQGIRTEKVRVDIASIKGWADYVFAKDYTLMPLKDLENYITANGHLPNIPKAEEVVKEGIDLGAMDSKLLEKIEELTLHTIELNKKNESQQKTIENLVQRLEQLEKNLKQ